MRQAMIASGRSTASEELLRDRLEKAGFVDVQTFTLHLPNGPWPKDKYEPRTTIHSRNLTYSPLGLNRNLKKLGMMLLLHAETGFHSYGIYIDTGKCKPVYG
jgi:hypothetical protein